MLEVKIKTGKQKLEANVHEKIKEARDGRKLVSVLGELTHDIGLIDRIPVLDSAVDWGL